MGVNEQDFDAVRRLRARCNPALTMYRRRRLATRAIEAAVQCAALAEERRCSIGVTTRALRLRFARMHPRRWTSCSTCKCGPRSCAPPSAQDPPWPAPARLTRHAVAACRSQALESEHAKDLSKACSRKLLQRMPNLKPNPLALALALALAPTLTRRAASCCRGCRRSVATPQPRCSPRTSAS